jgi:trimeric autotransporter adhesin
MERHPQRRPSSSIVISLLALFVALGGTAYASSKVGTADLRNRAVTTPKLADTAVTRGKLADGAVGRTKIANGAVTSAKIPDSAVKAEQIADGAVHLSRLADGSVDSSKIVDGSVRAPDLGTITERENSATITPNAHSSVTVSCQPGEVVLGGGHTNTGSGDVVNTVSRKQGNGWIAFFKSTSASNQFIFARALCLAG